MTRSRPSDRLARLRTRATASPFGWRSRAKRKQLSLIAGGTGISLPYQVASKLLSDLNDPIKQANQTPDDIPAMDYIDEMVKNHSDRFEVWYTVDRVRRPLRASGSTTSAS